VDEDKNLIDRFEQFFQINYEEEILRKSSVDEDFLKIEFSELSMFDLMLAEELLENPEETLKAAQYALERFDTSGSNALTPRFSNLPASTHLPIREARSKHLDKLHEFKGIVKQKNDVRPQLIAATFQCPRCQTKQVLQQNEKKLKTPRKCGDCGWKGSFNLVKKNLQDIQKMVLEEAPEELTGGEQPKRINVFLKDDLVSPISDKKTNPGSKIAVSGILKEVPINLSTGAKSTQFDLIIEGNYVKPVQEEFSELDIDSEQRDELIQASKDPKVWEKLVESMAPSIYGHDKIKEALTLQLFGGCRKSQEDGVNRRGDIHILLIGDPGAGKSQLLKRMSHVAPKSRFVSGKGASGAGLCVAPETKLYIGNGERITAKEFVERNLTNPSQVKKGVWKQEYIGSEQVHGLNIEWKAHTQKPETVWKLKAPEQVYNVKLEDGREIEITGNTKLLTTKNAKFEWLKAKEITEKDYIGIPESTPTPNKLPYLIDIISTNPTIHGVEDEVSKVKKQLSKKYGSIREAAHKLDIHENNLYHSWVNAEKRGTISLRDFKKICEDANHSWKEKISEISLYNGKRFNLPTKPNKNFFYILGLLIGDGDLRKTKESKSYQVRLSNKEQKIHDAFQAFLSEWRLNFDVQPGSDPRPKATRTTNKTLGEILLAFGMQESPKEDLMVSSKVRRSPREYIANFLAGLYDADGCVHIRSPGTKGSDTIEFYTTSRELAHDVQSLLNTFSIQSRIRERPPKKGKIHRKKNLYVLTIYGSKNILKFKEEIPLKHPKKQEKLLNHKEKRQNPNRDIIPNISREILKKINPKRVGRKASYNIGRNTFKKYASQRNHKEFTTFTNADVRWEKVKEVNKKKPDYEYVYDITIPHSHNFVANNILVHNTASVVKDEFLKGWALEAGALVLANKGLACIDELDKMSQEDASAMHEALEQQSITISKANIQATLKSQTTVLAAANPKYGRFDPYEVLAKQIELSSTLINRFDLIFPIRDVPDKDKDNKLASFILNLHKDEKKKDVPFDTDFIKRYVAFAKQRVDPALSKAALREIRDYFIKMRNSSKSDDKIQSIPISARQLEGLVRLAEASAKTRLSSTVEKRDAERAVDLLHHCLTQIGYDQETGEFDIDRITTGVTASQRSQISIIKEIISTLEEEIGKLIPMEDIVQEAEAQDIPEEKTDKIIMKLKQGGDIYSPKSGYISRI